VVDAKGAVHTGDDEPVPVRAVGREWRLSPGVFWQVHPALPDVLATVVGEWAAAPRGGTAWDLYGGVGLFAAVLAEQVGRDGSVTVVEAAQAAADDGRAALADLPQVGWRVGRVEKVLGGLPADPDVIVADPPRKGLGRAVVDAEGAVHAQGDEPVLVRAAGREWRLSPGVFWQVHPALPDVLATVVGEWATAPRGGTAWDLYGGVGLFAAVLAEQVGPDGSVTVVESARAAVDDGRAALADLPQVGWRVGRVEKVLVGLPGPPDVVVADPPRKGLGRAVVDALAAHGPERVVYVACDPAALARDVAFFAERGYTLAELRAFDAFPMTHHMECVALLTRPT